MALRLLRVKFRMFLQVLPITKSMVLKALKPLLGKTIPTKMKLERV
jgi:hypothetical protein